MKTLICILAGTLLPLSISLAEKPADGGKEAPATDGAKKADGAKKGGAAGASKGKGDRAASMLKNLDTDSSGGISLAEMKAGAAKRASAGGAAAGGSKGGSTVSVEDRFKKMDADGDGEVTKEELAKMAGGRGGSKGAPKGKGDAKGGSKGGDKPAAEKAAE